MASTFSRPQSEGDLRLVWTLERVSLGTYQNVSGHWHLFGGGSIFDMSIPRILAFLNRNLGHCPRCARKAFLAMAVAAFSMFVVTIAEVGSQWLLPGWLVVVLLAMLWVGHLALFAKRASFQTRRMLQQSSDPVTLEDRREALGTFFRAFCFAMVLTSGLNPKTAEAAECECYRPESPKCCWNYDRTIYVCAPEDANCCAHEDDPWYCEKGSSCYGDGNSFPLCY